MYGYAFITANACSLRASTSASSGSAAASAQNRHSSSAGRARLRRRSSMYVGAPARPEPLEGHRVATRSATSAARRATKSSTVTPRSGCVAPPPVHADGAVLDVVVADHEHVRHLLELGPADARAERVGVRVDELGAEAVGLQAVDELAARSRRGGRRPAAPSTCTGASHARERAGVVLDEDGEEPLDRPEQRAVDHDRAVPLVVGADVLAGRSAAAVWKSSWIVDICHVRPMASRRLHRDLRAVERAAALVHHELEVLCLTPRRAAPRWLRPTPRRCRPPSLAAWSTARGRSRRGRSRAAGRARSRAATSSSSAICSLVQKMCASSWVMPRTRVRPCTTPDFS